MAYDGETHLVRGDVRTRRTRIIHDNVECPSLSPDGRRIGYKKLVSAGAGSPKIWHFTVLDLKTMRETPLAEPAPRDDQLEWLDDDHVLYANGEEIWTVPADGSGAARALPAGRGFARRRRVSGGVTRHLPECDEGVSFRPLPLDPPKVSRYM